MTLSEESDLTKALSERHREEVREIYVHSRECRVHEPHLSLCSCGLETRIKDALVDERVRYSFVWEKLCRITGERLHPIDAVMLLKDGHARYHLIRRALFSNSTE